MKRSGETELKICTTFLYDLYSQGSWIVCNSKLDGMKKGKF